MPFQTGMKIPASGFDDLVTILKRISTPTNQDLDRIERSVRFGFASNFARQAQADGPPWASLRPRTVRERALQGYGPTGPVLERSGNYRDSWVTTRVSGARTMSYSGTMWTMSVTSSHPNRDALELGAPSRNLPARPVIYLDTNSINNIAAAVNDFVDRKTRA